MSYQYELDLLKSTNLFYNKPNFDIIEQISSSIRKDISYKINNKSFCRKLLIEVQFNIGEHHIYESDCDFVLIDNECQTVKTKGERILIRTFDKYSNINIGENILEKSNNRQFSIFHRVSEKLANDICGFENEAFFRLSDDSVKLTKKIVGIGDRFLSKDFDKLNKMIRYNNKDPNDIVSLVMNPKDFFRLSNSDKIDVDKLNIICCNANVLTSKFVLEGTFFAYADPEYVGAIGYYPTSELNVYLSSKDNKTYDFMVVSETSIGIMMPNNIVMGIF
jgi:hypothetical protein